MDINVSEPTLDDIHNILETVRCFTERSQQETCQEADHQLSPWTATKHEPLATYSYGASSLTVKEEAQLPGVLGRVFSEDKYIVRNPCEWVLSIDGKFLIGYISVINPQQICTTPASLGAHLIHGGQYGAVVDHVTPGTIADMACRLKFGDEIVEWNGQSLKNKNQTEINRIVESTRASARVGSNRTRIVAVRPNNNLIDFSNM